MKVRRKKLWALLISVALSVTDILPVRFSVSASEMEQSDSTLENDGEIEDNLQDDSVFESESSTDKNNLLEESFSIEDAETKVEIITEELEVEKEETDTEALETKIDDNSTEMGTQEESFIIEEIENDNAESDALEQETEQELNVTTSDDDIASGKYGGITWVIDAEGKLTVTGTGEFIIGYKPEDGYEAGDSLWYDYSNSIVSAEINVTGAKNASNMFYGCSNLKSVDLSGFDTSNVMSMGYMFYGCSNLASADLSSFDTRNVTDMSCMFSDCSSLKSVDLSSFDTRNVTDMVFMFSDCSSLKSVNLSSFDTSSVTTDMSFMFSNCSSLTTIYVPRNLTKSVSLPRAETEDVWYQPDGTVITELPRNLSYSIMITKNSIPMIVAPYIMAEKVKTVYKCGDSLTIDDLTVRLYNTDGTVKEITEYSTNKDEIDMSTIGKKTLAIIYNDMTTDIELTVTQAESDNIASGSYNDITWVIDAEGNLTVTGIGNFTGSSGYNRAPWYNNRTSIISAEINVSDMKNASYMFYGCENLTSIDTSGFDTRNVTNMQSMFKGCSNLTSINVSNLDTRNVTNMQSMFYECENLTSIVGINGFDTKNVISMEGMFYHCENLASVDVSDFNTKNVTSMRSMFAGCKALTGIDLSSFDTENIIDMYHMFGECKSLVDLDLSSFNTENVINMGWMFSGCSSLVSIDLSSFDVGNVIYMWNIFDGCSSLVSIDLSSFDVGNITIDLGGILNGCSKLTTIYTPYNLEQYVQLPKEKTEDIWYKPDGARVTILPQDLSYSIKLSKNDIPTISDPYITAQKKKTVYQRGDVLNIDDLTVKFYNTDGTVKKITDYETNKDEIDMSVLGNKTLKVIYNNMEVSVDILVHEKQDIASGSYENVIWVIDAEGVLTVTGKGDFAKTNTGNNRTPWYENRLSILSAKINLTDTTDASYMFYGCQKLKSVDLKNFDTETVSSMRSMFNGCTRLEDLDLSSFNTVSVMDMGYMFGSCSSLTSIDLTNFDTQNVMDISYMFNSCQNLTSVSLTGFDTSKVTNMSGMFRNCYNLGSVNLSNLNTSKVTDMSSMFSGCSELSNPDVDRFITSNVTNMSNMFFDCSGLEGLNISGFDTGKVTNMRGMFSGCDSLVHLNVSHFNTGKVTDMRNMFSGCGELTSLNVSGFDTRNVVNISGMFDGCCSLLYLDLSGFDLSKINAVEDEESTNSLKYMLYDCDEIDTIYTPYNLTQFVVLPEGTWYQSDGTVITELPRNLSYSILISKNSIPTVDVSHITASKSETIYVCGDVLNVDDLTVRFYSTDGTVKTVTNYTTNADTIDMFTVGTKTLIITYNNMTTEIELTIIQADSDNIASGSYQDIGWVIDANGKLIVEGTGDFAASSVGNYEIDYNRAPWYEYRLSIISAVIKTTDMTDASYMFYNCENLRDVDLSNFDTGSIMTMKSMFGCAINDDDVGVNKLTSLDLSSLDTSNVTDMSGMFGGCENLVNLDLSNFNTGNVTNMEGMFFGCNRLSSLDVSKFDTRNVTNMRSMFFECERLSSLNVSKFNTKKVMFMNDMFAYCGNLKNLDVSGFDTENVISTAGMFHDCSGLTSLNVQEFDTGNVVNMRSMFSGCSGLKQLDVSAFDTRKVTDMCDMFFECSSLGRLDLSSFDTRKVRNMCGMFSGCSELTNIDLSSFDIGAIDTIEDDNSYTRLKDMLYDCTGLTTIYTPYNLSYSIILPIAKKTDIWYQNDGTAVTELPPNLSYSIKITKNHIPTIDYSYIKAQKIKISYVCGDTLDLDDLTVMFYNTDGTVRAVTDYTTNADTIDMSTAGTKTLVITYNNMTAEIELTVTSTQQDKTYTVTFDLCGHGVGIAPITDITAGSLISEPLSPTADGYRFIGWFKDLDYIHAWDFSKDTVQENITLYAYWMVVEDYIKVGKLLIQEISAQTYTGSAVKPTVKVQYQSNGTKTLLKAGTDYTIKYYNNIQADTDQEKTLGGTSQTDTGNGFTKDLAYIVITCKGNYNGTVYQNFHINPAAIADSEQNTAKGFTLNYTDQFVSGSKALKPFSSLKYKKTMKAGTDYTVKLTAKKAYDANKNALTENSVIDGNSVIPVIPAGYQGTFLMTITGINNYNGIITKTIYVTDKNHLMKNASVIQGKNQKSMKYTGEAITLTPAWYDISAKKYYIINDDDKRTEADKNDVFTIKLGTEYLLYGRDFTIGYRNNKAVGTATMTLIGIGDYIGTKNVTFRITGITFKTKNIRVSNLSATMVYTGEALEQNEVVLTDISGLKPNELVCGTDYTVNYKNNLKKGTATMTFTAKPISGYSGSFKQTFKITAAGLSEITDVAAADLYNDKIITESGNMRLDGKIIYTKEGAKPSERIVLTNQNTNNALKEGTDYTVSYANNKMVTTGGSLATMTIKGKGNYAGIITINFPIVKASLSENENLTVAAASMVYNAKKADDYRYQPQIKLNDKKKALSASKDYEVVEYKNCSQAAVKSYLEALVSGTASADERPYAIIKAREGSGYEGSLEVDLNIYQTKFTAKNLYIIVSAENTQITYTGKQVKPEVTVYYGEAEAIKQAKAAGENKENILTDQSGSYKLAKLNPNENGTGDYTLVYGANITAGKNKGSITVNGTGLYGGKVTVKFTILRKDVHDAEK